jgi:hypothetical protein
MSLSFVASAVLSSTDGISHNEETEIENKEVDAVRKNASSSKSLFEQLRENQDTEEEKKAEMQQKIMRGTMALDEEDVAHLDALQKSKNESELKNRTELEQELAMFRAAKEERLAGQVVVDDDEEEEEDAPKSVPQVLKAQPVIKPLGRIVPKIVGKRKRKVAGDAITTKKIMKETKKEEPVAASAAPGGLGSLLGGYGSSSDEDE